MRYARSAMLVCLLTVFCGDGLSDLDFKQEMVDFVVEISDYAKSKAPGFYVFPQNAAELWSEPDYLGAVDGIGQEDIYYGYDGDGIATPSEITSELELNLAHFRNAGKLVLTVDYPFEDADVPEFSDKIRARIDDAYSRSSASGFVAYCAVRNLGSITVNPGHEPQPNLEPLTVLDSVRDFLYILQHDEAISRSQFLDSISGLGFDLIVMDFEDVNGGEYTPEEIAALKQESGAILIAYMSIGEAEDYRFYWQDEWNRRSTRPGWIEGENPSWPGNYLVRYWDEEWKQIIFGTDSSYLDRIISQGFDGVYLDKVDSYEDYID